MPGDSLEVSRVYTVRMTDDYAILRQIGAEMKRILLDGREPGEHVDLPGTLDDGRAAYALANLYFGDAGEAETVRAVDVDGAVLFLYGRIFQDAYTSLGMTEADMTALFQRVRKFNGGVLGHGMKRLPF